MGLGEADSLKVPVGGDERTRTNPRVSCKWQREIPAFFPGQHISMDELGALASRKSSGTHCGKPV